MLGKMLKKYFNFRLSVVIALLFILFNVEFVSAREKYVIDSTVRSNTSGDFIQLPQGIIHYEMSGAETAETVLLMCGFSAGYTIWDSTFHYLKEAGFRVIRFEHFGRGYSDRICGNYDKAFYQTEITEFLKALT